MKLFSRVEEILSSAAATGASTTIEVAGFATVGVALHGGGSTYAATVAFQGTVDGSNWVNLLAMCPADGSLAASVVNSTNTYIISVAGLSGFRLNVTAYTDGKVTGMARRTVGGGGLSVADVEISSELTISELPTAAAAADGFTNPTHSNIGAFLYAFNGTTWDRMVGSTDGGLKVSLAGDTAIQALDDVTNPATMTPVVTFLMGYNDSGTWDRLSVDDAKRLRVMEDWNSTLQGSTTADNEVTFAVPADKDWHIMWIWLEYTSGATAGTRQIQVDVRDSGDDIIMSMIPGVTQAESLTYRYLFAPGMADLTAVRDTDYIMSPMPPSIIIPELFDIRIYDMADIQTDTQEDSVVIQMMVMDRGRVDT